ncbi:DUF4097 family beta strand repeat-containing protein [Thermophagus sp. OGC60D27]|uniref:DUF4097 family beta strand repeat-containing protein n=1 Tax=Thermophagus sp. OGC60D27 TaxID=3458415 RepID=UPI004037FDB8
MKRLVMLIFLSGIFSLASQAQSLKEICNMTKSFKNTDTVKIDANFCKVTITSAKTDSINVQTVIKASTSTDGFGLKEEISNNTLELYVMIPDTHVSTKTGEIILSVPAGVNVFVQTTSGYIQPQNLYDCYLEGSSSYGKILTENVSGHYKFKTSTGIISVKNLKGDLSTMTKSGSIELYNIDGKVHSVSDKGIISADNILGNLTAQTNTAAQNISNVKGNLMLRTSTGILTLKNIQGQLQTLNDDGDVWIDNLKGTMDLKSLAGKLVGTAIQLTKSSTFETTKGRVEMELKNPLNELTFDLESNFGFLYIPGKSKKKKLTSGKGPIVITARTNSGPQRFTLAK